MDGENRITINPAFIKRSSESFLSNNKSNPFYDKHVFFTQGLRASKYTEFQIIGNLGGRGDDIEYNSQTDYFVVADSIINALKQGVNNKELMELEERLNAKGKRINVKILSESALLRHVHRRCMEIGDEVTLALINRIL